MNNYLIIDVETTIKNTGDPFDIRNKLCVVGLRGPGWTRIYDISYSNSPYGEKLLEIKNLMEQADVIVGFNLKFDLHWLRRYINDIDFSLFNTWDCQLIEFLLSAQRLRFPALNEISSFYNHGSKLDVIATDYWNHGIETDLVPFSLLSEYLTIDLDLTEKLYVKQLELLKNKSKAFHNLVKLHNMDTVALEEMEWNGLKVDIDTLFKVRGEVTKELAHIDQELLKLSGVPDNVPLNLSSAAQLSAIIYGGNINFPDTRIKKTTLKSGQIKEREVNCVSSWICDGFCTPIAGTETEATKDLSDENLQIQIENALEEYKAVPYRKYKTDIPTLNALKPTNKTGKRFIELLLQRSNLEQQLTTYLNKLPEMLEEHHWQDNIIHGQFNQCVAKTGRLSSSKPNLQNLDTLLHHLFISRHATN